MTTRWLKSLSPILIALFFATLAHKNTSYTENEPLVSTFSIVAYDPANGDLGVAVQSKFPNVRPIVPWAKAGVGAVATQSFASLDYGTKGLELMANGATAEEALRIAEIEKVDLAAGEQLKIDREVLEDIRKVFREGLWKPKRR